MIPGKVMGGGEGPAEEERRRWKGRDTFSSPEYRACSGAPWPVQPASRVSPPHPHCQVMDAEEQNCKQQEREKR